MKYGVIEDREKSLGLYDSYLVGSKEEAIARAKHVYSYWTSKERQDNQVMAIEVEDSFNPEDEDDYIENNHISAILWDSKKEKEND